MKRPSKLLRMATDTLCQGVFAINKPRGHSSAQIVRECQKAFNPSRMFKPLVDSEIAKRLNESNNQFSRRKAQKKASQVKIGHGGTLDPLATGVLILGVGSGTKRLPQFLECTKTYETVILFGASTDTYDRVGRVLTRRPYDHITREKVEEELAKMKGKQHQIPPLYSALKMNGKPLYEYAREGKPIPREIEGREVEVTEIELVEWYPPGKHNHRWPVEEAEAAERHVAEQVWRVKKLQEENGRLSQEEKVRDDEAIAAHESFKKRFEERQDQLIRDAPPTKRQRHTREPPMMSGALGVLPQPTYSNKGTNLVPDAPAENTPPPWSDEGPPACKVRLTVTSGFYVRSFCHDLGVKLDSVALMAELCRSRQSDFTVGGETTLEFDDLAKGEEVWGPQVANMLARWNGKSEGIWPPPESSPSAASPAKNHEAKRDGSPRPHKHHKHHKHRGPDDEMKKHKGEKRRREESTEEPASPPRKAPAVSSQNGDKPERRLSVSARSDDEKSWKGIED